MAYVYKPPSKRGANEQPLQKQEDNSSGQENLVKNKPAQNDVDYAAGSATEDITQGENIPQSINMPSAENLPESEKNAQAETPPMQGKFANLQYGLYEENELPENNAATSEKAKPQQNKKQTALTVGIILLVCFALMAVFIWFFFANIKPKPQQDSTSGSDVSAGVSSGEDSQGADSSEQDPDGTNAGTGTANYTAVELPEEMRGMWYSFLELKALKMETEDEVRQSAQQIMENCQQLGINTFIMAVRPFADSIYPSEIFPWSHVINGTQGQDPGFDPLQIFIEEAHNKGLRFEAWINPYRVQHPTNGPKELAADNPAVQNPGWVKEQNGLWYDPGQPEVRQLIINGVIEIIDNYDVDGIHFDDYFYPEGADEGFDSESFAAYGAGQELADWRRQNVNTLVAELYAAIKAANAGVSFGISPTGNNEYNANVQYSDVKLWMQESGYTDYVMPQLYWGFDYSKNGSQLAAFANKVAEWGAFPLNESVKLYCGLGAYRIGAGDGGDGDMAEWQSGRNLADMIEYLRNDTAFSGFCLFRYAFLYEPFDSAAYPELAALEREAIINGYS